MEFTKDILFSNVLRANKTSKITYSGDLCQKQSETVTIVYGFGENWDYTTEKEMIKEENGFTVEIEMKENFDTFNFCFRNGNYEWDNNQYGNYISSIQPAIVEVQTVETETFTNETDDTFDSDFIIEILDSLLEENLNSMEDDKQQILDDILAENATGVQAPVMAETFDMDALIDSILNPVINYETLEDDFDDIVTTGESGSVLSEQGLEELANVLNATETTETKEDTALVPTKDTYLVSPRKLRKFYLFVKKVKLAFYKLFVSIPKILSGDFEENKN